MATIPRATAENPYYYAHPEGQPRCSCEWPAIWDLWPFECRICGCLLPDDLKTSGADAPADAPPCSPFQSKNKKDISNMIRHLREWLEMMEKRQAKDPEDVIPHILIDNITRDAMNLAYVAGIYNGVVMSKYEPQNVQGHPSGRQENSTEETE